MLILGQEWWPNTSHLRTQEAEAQIFEFEAGMSDLVKS